MSGARSIRRARAVESFRSAAEAIGELVPNLAVFAVTRGQWSMIDAILAVLDQTGPAAVSCWTWTVAEYEVEQMRALRTDQRITSGLLVVDAGVSRGERRISQLKDGTHKEVVTQWLDTFGAGSVRHVTNHAKIATIEGGGFKVLLRGSMNLNHNPRFEQFDLTEGGPDFDLVRQIESELPIINATASSEERSRACKLGEAWTQQDLTMFGRVKTWAK